MSKLLKSKLFLGVMLVAVLFVGVVAVNATPAAAVDCSIYSTLRVGSVGTEVSCLQTHLGILADGKFGPMTAAAVKAWQAGKGLAADGVFGPMSRAAMAGSVSTGLPAGCMSTAGYSSTTGVKCDSSVSTGLPAGCMSTSGYSSTTGAKCDGGSTSTGPLSGGAGSITVDLSSEYSNENVGEGEEDVEVLAFDVEADDESDVEVTSVKVEFSQNTGADSDKLDDYAESVSVWFDGKKVGESDADDFNESSDVYSRNISLDGVVIRAGDEERITIAVTALSNLDSGDIDTDQFNVGVSSLRFEDGEGVVTTENFTLDVTDGAADDELEKLFDFEDFAGASDVELVVALSDEDEINEAHVIEVDASDDTDGVEILSFDLEAEGDSDIWIDEIPVEFTVTGGDLHDMASTVYLFADGEEIASEAVTDGLDADETITFEDLDYTIDAGDTVTFTVEVDLKSIADGIAAGDTIQAQITGTERALIDAEDESNESLATGDMTGTAVGEAHGMYENGIMVSNFSSTYVKTSSDTSGVDESVQFNLEFDVTAFGDDIWVDQTCAVGTTGTDVDAIEVSVDNAGTNTDTCTFTASTGDTGTDGFEVEEDKTETFTVTVLVVADNATATVRARLEGLGFNVTTDAVGDTVYSFNMDDYETSAVTIFNRP